MTGGSDNPVTFGGLTPGDSLGGKYRIEKQIGAGGTAVVWKALDSLLGRTVAIKQLRPDTIDLDDEPLRKRFVAESKIQRQISDSSDHLVAIHELIDNEQGLFIVMEYISGHSLESLLRNQTEPFEPRRVLGILGATALALDALHQQGVIHRDLKPSNILLPSEGGLKVCDFGLATLLADQDALAMGSVRYMAPELAGGQTVDGRADLYSLGMIAYELLAGREAFEQAFRFVLKDQRNQALRWMKWHANRRAVAPRLSTLNNQVSASLNDLVDRLMQKDPDQRIASGQELFEAIRRHFSGSEPTVTPTPSSEVVAVDPNLPAQNEPTAALPRVSRLPYILVGILLLQLAGFFAFLGWQNHREQVAREAMEQQAKLVFSEAVKNFDIDLYGEALASFSQLSKQWPDHPMLGRYSRGWELLCQGHQFLQKKDYQEAADAFIAADASDVFKPQRRAELQTLIRESQRRASFFGEIRQIEQMLTEKKFDLARQRLADQASYTPNKAEQLILEELGIRLEGQVASKKVGDLLAHAKGLVAAGQRTEAITYLQEQGARHPSRLITKELQQLKQNQQYDEWIADADLAERQSRLNDAVTSLAKAQLIRADAKVATRINTLKGQSYYEQGVVYQQAGNLSAARGAYTKALSFSNNRLAKAALQEIKTADQKTAFLEAASDAISAGNFDAAIKQYENALALEPDSDVRQKMTRARVEKGLAFGNRNIRAGHVEAARQALEEAKSLAPDDSRIALAMKNLKMLSRYQDYLAQGDELRQASRFGPAKVAYGRAKKIINNTEIKQRLEDAEYDHLLAQAQHRMKNKQWTEARILLKLAYRINPSKEVLELLDSIGTSTANDG